MMGNGTWNEWSRHILTTLGELDNDIKKLEDRVSTIHDDIIELKLKCRIVWGVLGTLLGSAITLIILVIAGVIRYG